MVPGRGGEMCFGCQAWGTSLQVRATKLLAERVSPVMFVVVDL